MKDIELDKYIGHTVKIVFFDNFIKIGILYKIENYKVKDYYLGQYLVPYREGYFLDCPVDNYSFRKSHIKKISKIL